MRAKEGDKIGLGLGGRDHGRSGQGDEQGVLAKLGERLVRKRRQCGRKGKCKGHWIKAVIACHLTFRSSRDAPMRMPERVEVLEDGGDEIGNIGE